MSAPKALEAAHAAGIIVTVDGNDLMLQAPVRPASSVLEALTRYKVEIVALLRPEPRPWSAEDWRTFFHERAGIIEFDCGLQRPQAEAQRTRVALLNGWIVILCVRRPAIVSAAVVAVSLATRCSRSELKAC